MQNYIDNGPVVSTRRLLKFSIWIYRKNKPHPLATMFFLIKHHGLYNLGSRSLKEHFS